MIEYVALALAWLLLATALSVFVGKCIAVGQAGETARHARAAAAPGAAAPQQPVGGPAGEDAPPVLEETLVVPPQRRPSVPADQVT
jgi:hypothetical protein